MLHAIYRYGVNSLLTVPKKVSTPQYIEPGALESGTLEIRQIRFKKSPTAPSLSIYTNTVTLNAQRNLRSSGSTLATSMQRLSSGLRVNSAKDDAAGLAIAERMLTGVRGLTVAQRNTNDGISLMQTAEGALGKMGDMLQRMRALSVQSANATNSDADRSALQAEVAQLRAELDRLAKTTTFNGRKMLEGSFAGAVFQVGEAAGSNITVGSLVQATAAALGKSSWGERTLSIDMAQISNLQAVPAGTLQLAVNGQSIALAALPAASTPQERLGQVVAAINGASTTTGMTAYMEATAQGGYQLVLLGNANASGATVVDLLGFDASVTGLASGGNLPAPQMTYDAYVQDLGLFQSDVNAMVPGHMQQHAVPASPVSLAQAQSFRTDVLNAYANAWSSYSVAGFALERNGAGDAVFTDASLWADGQDGVAIVAVLRHFFDNLEPLVVNALVNGKFHNGSGSALKQAMEDLFAQGSVGVAVIPSDSSSVQAQILEAWQMMPPYTDNGPTPDFDPASYPPSLLVSAVNQEVGSSYSAADIFGSDFGTYLTADGSAWLGGSNNAVQYQNALAALQVAQAFVSQHQPANQGSGIRAQDVQQGKALVDVDISTQAGSWKALHIIDRALDEVNASRAYLGAMQSRFEKVIENILVQQENLSAAHGRIVDADYAVESASLSRTQILQQAGTAMVAQANQLPKNVLQLLQ